MRGNKIGVVSNITFAANNHDCFIAPVSSWAAAVGSSLPEDSNIDGFALFLETIPFNLYAILTMAFMIFIIVSERDFATMGKAVKEFKIPAEYRETAETELHTGGNGKIFDLVLHKMAGSDLP